MKKFIMTLMASMLLLSSTTYAVETSKSHNPAKQMMTMSKTDAQKMFGEAGTDMHAVTLSQDEMAKTEGEFFPIVGFVLTLGKVLWKTAKVGGKIYSKGKHKAHHNFGTKKRPSWRKHYQWNTSHGKYRVPYGKHYLHKSRPDLGFRSRFRR